MEGSLIHGAEGECGNSQAKGPNLDDTLESDFGTDEAIFLSALAG